MIRMRKYRPDDREQLRQLVLELHETLRPLDTDLAPGPEIIDAYFEHRRGVHRIDLKVLAGNQEAIRFYQRQGHAESILVMSKHLRVEPDMKRRRL